jgi:hypothetical protein
MTIAATVVAAIAFAEMKKGKEKVYYYLKNFFKCRNYSPFGLKLKLKKQDRQNSRRKTWILNWIYLSINIGNSTQSI